MKQVLYSLYLGGILDRKTHPKLIVFQSSGCGADKGKNKTLFQTGLFQISMFQKSEHTKEPPRYVHRYHDFFIEIVPQVGDYGGTVLGGFIAM